MTNMPNIPMTKPITTCRHKVDRKKYDEGYERAFGKKKVKEKKRG